MLTYPIGSLQGIRKTLGWRPPQARLLLWTARSACSFRTDTPVLLDCEVLLCVYVALWHFLSFFLMCFSSSAYS